MRKSSFYTHEAIILLFNTVYRYGHSRFCFRESIYIYAHAAIVPHDLPVTIYYISLLLFTGRDEDDTDMNIYYDTAMRWRF